jgi:hypothetical protein
MPLFLRAAGLLLNNWKKIIGLWGIAVIAPFSLGLFVDQAAESAIRLWWIGALIVLVILARDYMKYYFDIKKKEGSKEGSVEP